MTIFSEIPFMFLSAEAIIATIFTFPFKLIMNFAYAKLTHQKFVWQNTYSIDLIILGLASWIWYRTAAMVSVENEGFGFVAEPSRMLMFAQEYTEDYYGYEFNLQFFVGVCSSLYFIRLLLSLILTQTLGPIISTIIYMFNDIAVFIVIWLITLIGFTLVSMVTFNPVAVFVSFETAFLFWINAAFGNYDLGIFDVYLLQLVPLTLTRQVGIWFVLLFVFLNILVLLNVVVAMMADTYALMTTQRKGLYNYNIVKSQSVLKLDKYYGGLILLPYPFCVITFLLLPIYLLVSDKETLLAFNKGVYRVFYTFFSLLIGAVFLALNLAMMPFAYLKTVLMKLILVKNGGISICDAVFYIIIGLPVLLISQVTDLWEFLKTSNDSS